MATRHLRRLTSLLFLAGLAYASPITLSGIFSGANESTPTGSPGTGPTTAEAAFAAGFLAGKSYLNIHTARFAAGEVRAFLTPEPCTALFGAGGLAGLFLLRRRRQP